MADLINIEAEQALLGCMMFESGAFPALSDIGAHRFAEPFHQRLFSVIETMNATGQGVSYAAIKTALRGDQGLAGLNAATPDGDYLYLLVNRAPPLTVAHDMAAVVRDEWARRQVVEIAQNGHTIATESNPRPAVDVVSYMATAIADLQSQAGASDAEFLKAPDVAAAVVAQIAENMKSGRVTGKRCGLRCVDYRMGGFHPGSLIVVGGRPGMGKTALARAMAHGCAVYNPKDQVLFLGIEMGPAEMMERELAAITHELGDGVEYRDMSQGALTPHDMALTQKALGKVPANLILKDCHTLSLEDVRRYVWTRKRKGPLALVVIDYLQLMRKQDARGRNDSALWGEITAGLKLIARQAGCAIVLLSQLSRKVEEREDKRPMLSDLRESGSIEQDADFVIFPFREVYYLERTKPQRGKEQEHDMRLAELARVMEVICAKARRSSVGVDVQIYAAEYDHISDRVAA